MKDVFQKDTELTIYGDHLLPNWISQYVLVLMYLN